MGPLTLALLIGAGSALAKGAGEGIAALTPAARKQRQLEKADERKLASGKLGMSAAEKRTLMSAAREEGARRSAQQEANLARQSAAAGGFGKAGVADTARRVAADEIRATQSETGAQVNALSSQKALAENARIRDQIAARSKAVRDSVTGVADAGIEGAMAGAAHGLGTRVGQGQGYADGVAAADAAKLGKSAAATNTYKG